MSKMFLFAVVFTLFAFVNSDARFNSCKFNFGTDWDFLEKQTNSETAKSVDYVTIWFVTNSYTVHYDNMISWCKQNNKTPVFYSYVIAKASGLGDADVGGQLRTRGAGFLKNDWAKIKSAYENYASSVKSTFGTTEPTIWLMEPDYFQYFENDQTVKLSFADAAKYMHELIDIVKKHLPNAMFALDISPWCSNINAYVNSFSMAKFTFVYNSGGRTEGNTTNIRNDPGNNVTWAGAVNTSGKPFIADCGYGVGGGCNGHISSWDNVNNLKARIRDGVTAITQKCTNGNWGNTIETLKTSLASEKVKCFSSTAPPVNTYTLTVKAGTGGTVEKSANTTTYASGTTVTLTAKPATGYTFKNWSGDATGTNATTTVIMNANKSVSAVFEQVSVTQYSLTANATGSGTVNRAPNSANYASGTTVTLTAQPATGYTFKNWSGDATGTNATTTVIMNANKSVSAVFEQVSVTQYSLTANATGSGTVNRAPNSANYASGTTVTLTAQPATGYTFKNWSGDATGTNATTTVIMNANKSVSAVFEQVSVTQYSLTANVTGSGTVNRAPNSTNYASGTTVTLTAQPATGYTFKNWSGDATGTSATVTVTMTANRTISAVFEQIPSNEFSLTVNISGSGTLTKSPDKTTYSSGAQVILTASPENGSVFEGWSGAVTGSNQTVTVVMSANKTVTATFRGSGETESIKVEAEDFTNKSHENIKVETHEGYKNIGYIENGNATTYEVDIPRAANYTIEFRVANGVENTSFGVFIDNVNEGTINDINTGGWQTYVTQTLSSPVQLAAGKHSIRFNFNGPINMDYFTLSTDAVSTISARQAAPTKTPPSTKLLSSATGFKAILPAAHTYISYSLVDLSGQIVRSGILSHNSRELQFDHLTREVWILRLDKPNGTDIIRAAMVR